MRVLSPLQLKLINDFMAAAESMGHAGEAALPSNHPAIKLNQWDQIRRNDGDLARYRDELGNTVTLDARGVVRQLHPNEVPKCEP